MVQCGVQYRFRRKWCVLDPFPIVLHCPAMDQEGAEKRAGAPPPWLNTATLCAMEAAFARMLAWGREALAARDSGRAVLLARNPALPLPMIEAALAAVVPDAEGGERAPGHPGRAGGDAVLCPAIRAEWK